MQQYMPISDAFTDSQSPLYLIMLLRINILEVYDIPNDFTSMNMNKKAKNESYSAFFCEYFSDAAIYAYFRCFHAL